MAYDDKILQIIPADGWWAIYLLDEPPFWTKAKLACFALKVDHNVDGQGTSYWIVDGFDAADVIEECSGTRGFYVYMHDDEITEEIKAHWAEEGEKQAKKKAPGTP